MASFRGGYSNYQSNNSYNHFSNSQYKQSYPSYGNSINKQITLQNNGFANGLVQFYQFHPKDPNLIGATVSDGSVLLWNIDKSSNQSQVLMQQKIPESISSSCWAQDGAALYSCDILNRSVFSTSQTGTIQINEGVHDEPIHTIRFWQPNYYITASYDDTIKIWDIRNPPNTPVFTIQTQTQQSQMDFSRNLMAVVQCKCRGVSIFDFEVLMRGTGPMQNLLYISFYAPTEYQISTVKVCLDGKRVCFGTIDGTFFMKTFSLKERPKELNYYESQARTQIGSMYEKQIHRKDGPKTTLFMVNDILTIPKKQYVVGSVGGDGKLCLFNTSSKTATKKHQLCKTVPIKKCSVNIDSTLFGLALGNDYSGGFEQFNENICPIFQVQKVNEGFFSSNRYY